MCSVLPVANCQKLQEVLFMLELEQYKYNLSEIEEAIKEIEVSL